MSDVIPSTIIGRIQFFQRRIAAWTADPAAIGLTPAQVAELSAAFTAAANANQAALTARDAARNATAIQNAAMDEMVRLGSGMIATIRAFADLAADPVAVYTEADLPLPASRTTPLPPPEEAVQVKATLQQSGKVRVSWKGTVANGTYYDVYRKLEGPASNQSGFTLIGSSSKRFFEDGTVPLGTAQCSYYTIARRDDKSSGESQQAVIRFGVPNGPLENGSNGQSNNAVSTDNGSLGLAA